MAKAKVRRGRPAGTGRETSPLSVRVATNLRTELLAYCEWANISERQVIEALLASFARLPSHEARDTYLKPAGLKLGEVLERLGVMQHAATRNRSFWVLEEAEELEGAAEAVAPGLLSHARHSQSVAWLFAFDKLREFGFRAMGTERKDWYDLATKALLSAIESNLPFVRIDRVKSYNVATALSLLGRTILESHGEGIVTTLGPSYNGPKGPDASDVQDYAEQWEKYHDRNQLLNLLPHRLQDGLRHLAENSLALIRWSVDPESRIQDSIARPAEYHFLWDEIPIDPDLVFLRTYPDEGVCRMWASLYENATNPLQQAGRLKNAIERRRAHRRRSDRPALDGELLKLIGPDLNLKLD